MGIPKMPAEYELPNLCGANAGLGDVQKKIDEAIKNVTDRIEFSASDIKAKMESDFAEAKEKLSKLNMPSLPSLPDVSLQSEMTSIANIDTSTLLGRIQKEAKKLQVKNLFGDALEGKGIDFDTTLKNVESAIAGGGDACAACKNFMVKQGGKSTDVAEKPANTMTADFQSQKEEVSTVTTAAKAEGVGLSNMFSFLNGSTPIMGDTLGKAMKIIGEGGPNMNEKLEELNKETEASLKVEMEKAGIPAHPGVVKNTNELNQNKALFEVVTAKVDAAPTARTDSKDTAFKASTGAQKTVQETTNIELYYNKLIDDFRIACNDATDKWQRLENHRKKCQRPYPENIANMKSGKTVFSEKANPNKFKALKALLDAYGETLFIQCEQFVDDLDYDIRQELDSGNEAAGLTASRSKWEDKFKEKTKLAEQVGKDAATSFDDFFVKSKFFEIPRPPAGSPGGPKPNKFSRFRAQARAYLITQSPDAGITEVVTVKTHASGLLLITAKHKSGKTLAGLGPSVFTAAGNILTQAQKLN
tara:strand:+ start:1468 stop:3057 length:1590 start_codon:yes stop_codon:yes gene_type:complete